MSNVIPRWLCSQTWHDPMYVKIVGQLKTIKRIELTSDSATILLHVEGELGFEEVYKRPFNSLHHHALRNFCSSDIFIVSDIVCGIKDYLILMTLSLTLTINNRLLRAYYWSKVKKHSQ